MRFQKDKNEQISVGHFCEKHAMGAEMFQKHRPTELFTPFEALPLRSKYAQGGPNSSNWQHDGRSSSGRRAL